MRSGNNRLHLPTSNRPKVPHCLLFSRAHRTGRRRHFNPNTLRVYGGTNPNNRARPYFVSPLLSSQHQLRTDPQPNNSISPGPSDPPSSDNRVMVCLHSRQLGAPAPPQPYRRANNYCLAVQLILVDHCTYRSGHPDHRRLLVIHVLDNSTRTDTRPHHFP